MYKNRHIGLLGEALKEGANLTDRVECNMEVCHTPTVGIENFGGQF